MSGSATTAYHEYVTTTFLYDILLLIPLYFPRGGRLFIRGKPLKPFPRCGSGTVSTFISPVGDAYLSRGKSVKPLPRCGSGTVSPFYFPVGKFYFWKVSLEPSPKAPQTSSDSSRIGILLVSEGLLSLGLFIITSPLPQGD